MTYILNTLVGIVVMAVVGTIGAFHVLGFISMSQDEDRWTTLERLAVRVVSIEISIIAFLVLMFSAYILGSTLIN